MKQHSALEKSGCESKRERIRGTRPLCMQNATFTHGLAEERKKLRATRSIPRVDKIERQAICHSIHKFLACFSPAILSVQYNNHFTRPFLQRAFYSYDRSIIKKPRAAPV
jgi:hypothetical protein